MVCIEQPENKVFSKTPLYRKNVKWCFYFYKKNLALLGDFYFIELRFNDLFDS
ncbi:hypothetical protein DSECCO2_346190 [anaerobic digester metagenome]